MCVINLNFNISKALKVCIDCSGDIINITFSDENKERLFFANYYKKILQHNNCSKDIFEYTLVHLKKFLGEDKFHKLSFQDINLEWLNSFDYYLKTSNLKTNSRALVLKTIRRVFNYARSEELIDVYPFHSFRIKEEETIKRSLSINQIAKLWNSDIPNYLVKYLDCFKLIFYLIGINIVDLLSLKEINSEGRIEYYRHKTGRLYSIKIEHEALEIIERYRGSEHLLCFGDKYLNHRDFTSLLNKSLKKISGYEFLSSYWARHTWATLAASLDIPKETIAAALGHSMGNSTTAIYINFDRQKVDEANRKVINYINFSIDNVDL